MIDDWTKGWVKYSSEIWVPNGELLMICDPSRSVSCLMRGRMQDADLRNVIVEPFGAHFSRDPIVESAIVASHVLENIMHSLYRDFREEGFDEALMR